MLKKFRSKFALDAVFVVGVVSMGVFLHWKIEEIAIFAFFIWIILNPISSSYLAGGAIFFIILTPAFLLSGNLIVADRIAIYAYYFLIMAVMMGIFEVWRGKDPEPESDMLESVDNKR